MSQPLLNRWQAIHAEVLRRIHARHWPPGHIIPNEADLAREFGCARATVNRALQALADSGILERRRKVGTRVALHPVSRATVEIPMIRQEVSALGKDYGYSLESRKIFRPEHGCMGGQISLHLMALHLADGVPFVMEDRLINLTTIPAAVDQDFAQRSANEWLLAHVPYTHGDIQFQAAAASKEEAVILACARGTPVFVVHRTTWDHSQIATTVRLIYAPGYSIKSEIGTPP